MTHREIPVGVLEQGAERMWRTALLWVAGLTVILSVIAIPIALADPLGAQQPALTYWFTLSVAAFLGTAAAVGVYVYCESGRGVLTRLARDYTIALIALAVPAMALLVAFHGQEESMTLVNSVYAALLVGYMASICRFTWRLDI